MDNKYKIMDILLEDFKYIYCDSCRFQDSDNCEECHRKYFNWSLSSKTAANIADKIINIFDNVDFSNDDEELAELRKKIPPNFKEYSALYENGQITFATMAELMNVYRGTLYKYYNIWKELINN